MKIPIIMVAFGTTSKSITTYRYIGKIIKEHFNAHEVFWSFSSRIIAQRLQGEGMTEIKHPAELFCELIKLGYKRAVVQSLHLFGGREFDALIRDMQTTELDCISGGPLISSPQDYNEICRILQPLINTNPKKATLILGHGTLHPVWTAYYCLEKFLRQEFGPHVFVGTVEKYPDSSQLIEQLSTAGYEEVRIIPFFLVTGMHYRRDIIGDSESSWQKRFNKKNITVETLDQGLGMLPGFTKIITRHIETAITRGKTVNVF